MDAGGAINAGIATHGLIFARHAHHASDTRQKTGKSLMCANRLTMLRLMLVVEDPGLDGGMGSTMQALIGRDGGGIGRDGVMTANKKCT